MVLSRYNPCEHTVHRRGSIGSSIGSQSPPPFRILMRASIAKRSAQTQATVCSIVDCLTPCRPFVTLRAGFTSDHRTASHMNIANYLEQKRLEVDRFLDQVCPPATSPPTTLHESMRYSLMAGGKRVRPILAIAAAEVLGNPSPPGLMAVACSLELIHSYSLIHDDLPSM